MVRLVDLFREDKDVLSVLLGYLSFQDQKMISSIDRMSAQSPLRTRLFAQSIVRLPFPRLLDGGIDWGHYYSTTLLRGIRPEALAHISSVTIPHSAIARVLPKLPYLDTVCIWAVPKQLLREQQHAHHPVAHQSHAPQSHGSNHGQTHHHHQDGHAHGPGQRHAVRMAHARGLQRQHRRRRREDDYRSTRVMDLVDFSELTMITELHLHRSDVINFAEIANLTNLTSLDMSTTRLEDPSEFRHLASLPQLEKLNLCEARVRNSSFLQHLVKLKWLDIEATKISSLRDIIGLSELEFLNISDIWLEDSVVALTELKALKTLQASYIGSFEAIVVVLDAPDLQKCDLRGTTIQQLNFLSSAPSLRTLDLRETRLINLEGVGVLRNLRKLVLTANPHALRSVPWVELEQIEDLIVEKWHAAPAEYEVMDGSFFSHLANLFVLNIEQMSDFSWTSMPSASLARLTIKTFADEDEDRLVELAAACPRLDTLHIRVQHRPPPALALQSFGAQLVELRLVDAVAEDLSAVCACTGLEMLDLTVRETHTWRSLPKQVDFRFLHKFTKLRVLWLTGRHDFKDVSVLTPMTTLEVLRLDRTRVTEAEAVKTLTNLKHLSLDSTKMTALPDLRGLTKLEFVGVPAFTDCSPLHVVGAFPFLKEIWHEEGYNCFWTGHAIQRKHV
ncbi:hypothetical protein P43SY_007900 [Pythium insidiosum]|uniref:Uncharacterized protein n=1 Tax=Pythium insidiosum TaxID=114742 RepID=A0AAD5QAR3_PYTIN|nr:hypothetical protein P43SY_007900 [Pythium insidiosum]